MAALTFAKARALVAALDALEARTRDAVFAALTPEGVAAALTGDDVDAANIILRGFFSATQTLSANICTELFEDSGIDFAATPADDIAGAYALNGGEAFAPTFTRKEAADTLANIAGHRITRVYNAQTRASVAEAEAATGKQIRYTLTPRGPSACSFCFLLASRGAVYRHGDKNVSHAHCACVLTPGLLGDNPSGSIYKQMYQGATNIDTAKYLSEDGTPIRGAKLQARRETERNELWTKLTQ